MRQHTRMCVQQLLYTVYGHLLCQPEGVGYQCNVQSLYTTFKVQDEGILHSSMYEACHGALACVLTPVLGNNCCRSSTC